MVFNTLTVGAAVTPSVIETYFSHYLHRGPLKQKPTAHISYHEGLRLIREFLEYSSKHTVEDLQAFTAQWVPAPHWVRINDAEVAPKFLERAASILHSHLGNVGLTKLGGKTWWQWRRPENPLRAEWIEMKKEYHERKRTGAKCERVMLYVHGGAYYFGSVDEHRYQMQRHARKLRARVLAPRYRLAPQYPFPCGLYDCLATYFYLLEHFDPSQILFAGDSAGGGMILSMLVILRDQGQPLPAGTILLSPWVDLTHSFPSVAGDGAGDYIPPHGFHHKPSMAWPPPPSDQTKKGSGNYGAPTDAVELPATAGLDTKNRKRPRTANPEDDDRNSARAPLKSKSTDALTALPNIDNNQKIMIDGKAVDMKDQVQMYTTNELLAHPLVSPIMQPSLGGLPPMLIQVGGAELLQDEQMYLAHKAANPKAYTPSEAVMKEYDPQRKTLDMYPPTNVQIQLWEDLCHVAPTLSFTRPAKYMYRSVAQFGAWALSHAQQKDIEIDNDDALSVISSGEGDEDDESSIVDSLDKGVNDGIPGPARAETKLGAVGKAGEPLPAFKNHMIRQRVTRHGVIYPLTPASEMAGLSLDPASIGVIKPGPVRKWLAARQVNEQRFANERKKITKKRSKEESAGYDKIPGENPPPTALVNRVRKGQAPEEKKRGRSWGLAMWSGWGSSHDEHTLEREQKTTDAAAKAELQRKGSNFDLMVNGSENGSTRKIAFPRSAGDGDGGSRRRRTSSVSAMSSHLPWNKDGKPASTRNPRENVIRDAGQSRNMSPAPTARAGSSRGVMDSPVMAPSPVARAAAPSALSRRTSNPDSVTISRPASLAAANGLIPVPTQQQLQVENEGKEVAVEVPTTAAIAPDSEKIHGSENTYLSPTSSRPHNGVQAYPFKLREQGSNPSVVTLDSLASSSRAVPPIGTPTGTGTPVSPGEHSELMGDAPLRFELPSAAESPKEEEVVAVESPANEGAASAAIAAIAATTAAAAATITAAVAGPAKSVTGSPTDPAEPATAPASAATTKLKIPKDDTEAISPIEGPDAKATEAPISPVADTPTDEQDSKQKKPFKVRNTIFDPRTSMLGSIGADGMPNAHYNFTRDQSPPPRPPPAVENVPPPPQPQATKETTKPAEGEKKELPFKLRHTVYDPNGLLARGTSEDAPVPTSQSPTASAEKEVTPTKGRPSIEAPEAVITHQPSMVRSHAVRDSGTLGLFNDLPPSYESMPMTNVTMPETVPKRPMIVPQEKPPVKDDDDVPPPPPPKDAKHVANQKPTGLRKASSNGNLGLKTNGVLPTSKFNNTTTGIGEKKRPGMETFHTASEGRFKR